MQTIIQYDIEVESITLTCPQCRSTVELEGQDFVYAVHLGRVFKCDDCKCEYYVGTVLLDPRSPTPREPVTPIRRAGTKCKYCDEEVWVDDMCRGHLWSPPNS